MITLKIKFINKSFDEIIQFVKKSNFFCEKESPSLKDTFFSEINIENIGLPFRLKCFAHKQGITSLEELLNTKYGEILRCRNIGIGTIEKSRKIIVEYLNKIQYCFRNLGIKNYTEYYDTSNIIVKYFPLLKGTFRTTKLNFNFIYQDLSCIDVPKRINEYIKKKKKLRIIYDILNINYNELKKEQDIGHKTIGKLQNSLIGLLNLEKVIFLPVLKKYGITKYSVNLYN